MHNTDRVYVVVDGDAMVAFLEALTEVATEVDTLTEEQGSQALPAPILTPMLTMMRLAQGLQPCQDYTAIRRADFDDLTKHLGDFVARVQEHTD